MATKPLSQTILALRGQENHFPKGIYEKKHSTACNLIVATNTIGFTKNAEQTAQGNKVELVNRDKIKSLLKNNKISLADLSI